MTTTPNLDNPPTTGSPGNAKVPGPISPRIAVITHLSKEIEAQINSAVTWRTRSAFSVFIGPFVLLGAVIMSDKVKIASFSWIDYVWHIIGLGFCYMALGIVGALVEKYSWRRINVLGAELLKIGLGGGSVYNQDIENLLYNTSEKWKKLLLAYLFVFLAIFVATGIMISLIIGVLQSAG